MKDFVLAAFPWFILGLTIAIITAVTNGKSEKEKRQDSSTRIGIGMCFGVAIGVVFMKQLGSSSLTYGLCFGMLLGLFTGARKDKEMGIEQETVTNDEIAMNDEPDNNDETDNNDKTDKQDESNKIGNE